MLKSGPLLIFWLICMSASFIVSAQTIQFADAWFLTFSRFALAFAILSLVAWPRARLSHKTLLKFALLTAPLVGFFILMFWALTGTQALNTSVIYTALPLLALVIGRIWQQQKMQLISATGFIIGMLAAWNTLLHDQQIKLNHYDALFALGLVLLAVHVLLAQKHSHLVPAKTAAWLISGLGSLMLAPLLLFVSWPQIQWHQPQLWQGLAIMTVFATIATSWSQQKLVRSIGAPALLATTYWIPLVVALVTIGWQPHLGGSIILLVLSTALILRAKWTTQWIRARWQRTLTQP